LQGLQQGPADQVGIGVDLTLEIARLTPTFSRTHVKQLRRVIPFVEGFALLQAVIALQPNETALQGGRQGFGQLGLAHAGLALEQQGPAQAQRQEHGRGQPTISKITGLHQGRKQVVDALSKRM
jgi:hypothetical protein